MQAQPITIEDDFIFVLTPVSDNPDGLYHTDTDFVFMGDGDSARDAEIADFCDAFRITGEVINPSGPGGGWPVVRFTGTERALRVMVHHYSRGTLPETPQPFDVVTEGFTYTFTAAGDDGTYAIQLDFMPDLGPGANDNEWRADIARFARTLGLRHTIVQLHGPAGGSAVVEFNGTEAALRQLVAAYGGVAVNA